MPTGIARDRGRSDATRIEWMVKDMSDRHFAALADGEQASVGMEDYFSVGFAEQHFVHPYGWNCGLDAPPAQRRSRLVHLYPDIQEVMKGPPVCMRAYDPRCLPPGRSQPTLLPCPRSATCPSRSSTTPPVTPPWWS